MNKFDKIYNQILLQHKNQFQFENLDIINDLSTFKHKWFNVYQILNEYVEDPNLTPVPRQFFEDICNKIKTDQYYLVTYSFNQIYNLLKIYNYQYSEQFKNKLQQNGILYICSDKQINEQNFEIYDKLYSILIKTFNEDQIDHIIQKAGEDLGGVTSVFEKNRAFIFINQNRIINDSWKETLEHELTHFIQKIIGINKTLKRTKLSPTIDYNFYLNNKFFLDKLFNNKVNKYFLEFVSYIFTQSEQHTTIKNILNRFQKQCIKQGQKQNKNQWIKEKIEHLNVNFLDTNQWKDNIDFLRNKQWKEMTNQQKEKYNWIFAIIAYYLYKKFLNDYYNIDQYLIHHFNIFNK